MDLTGLGSLADLGKAIIDRVVPDPAQKAAAQLELQKLQQSGELAVIGYQTQAIVTEAQSSDKWTSRARPSFMYVMYVMLLWALPFSILWAFYPVAGARMADGLKFWLSAIPDSLYGLFGAGYLGYVGGRSVEKIKGVA